MSFIKRAARYKIYVDRARWYIVLVQFFMIVLIFIDSKGIELVWWHYPIVIVAVMIMFLIAGYIDRRSGLIKEEQNFYSTENPVIQEILNRLKDNDA